MMATVLCGIMALSRKSFQLSIETIPDGTNSSARDARRDVIIATARDAFFTHGYAGTAMSAIAAQVGGSKTTLWSHFPSKQDLFVAVIDDLVGRYGQALTMPLEPGEPLEPALRRFAEALMGTILSAPIIALHRVVTGEAARFPELGALFHERGPKRGKERLARFLEAAMAHGHIRRGDPMIAARQFAGLCQSGVFQDSVFGVAGPINPDDVRRDIDAAIDTFLRGWQPE